MKHMLNRGTAATAFLVCLFLAAPHARAELADLADMPLGSSSSDTVLPNLMYILDDSGSMESTYMPNEVAAPTVCKSCTSGGCTSGASYCSNFDDPIYGGTSLGVNWIDPPYFANEFNQIYYNPDITYDAAVDYKGVSLGDQPPTAAKNDVFNIQYTGTKNLLTSVPDTYYCTTASPTAAQLSNSGVCRRNGISNVQSGTLNYFLYYSNNLTSGQPLGGYPIASGGTTFLSRVSIKGAPYYFTISPHEYCSDSNLVNCALANADGTAPAGYSFPASLRYCKVPADAGLTTAVSDAAGSGAPKCRKKYDPSTYPYARYGRFRRVDIVPASAPFALRATAHRTDCAGTTSCTYNEEIQNFANWYSYYRFRMNMMKTASGRAFLSIDDRYRVGFVTINPGSPVSGSKYLPIATFDTTQKSSFYSKLYAQDAPGNTPLRQALARVGRHYAGITSGINQGMPQDPVQYSCQQNFALLTSDGYWNDSDSVAIGLGSTAVGNQDNVPNSTDPFFVARKNGTLDGVNTKLTNTQLTKILEQVPCTGSATTTFTAGTQTSCGCPAGLTRIKQRTIEQTTTVSSNDDIPNTPVVTPGTVTFQDMPATCRSLVVTTDTPTTIVAQQVVTGPAATTFAAINGAPGGNTAGACAASQKAVVQRTTTYTARVVTTNGVAGAPSNIGTTYAFSPIGSCVAPQVTTAVSTTTIVEQRVLIGSGSTTFTAVNGVAGGMNTLVTGCTSPKQSLVQRRTVYDTTVITTDGVAAPPTTGNQSYTFTTLTSCVTGPLTAAGLTSSTVPKSSVTTGGPTPVAAATTTTTGTPSTSNNGGTTYTSANITLNPNPTITPGVVTSTTDPGGSANTLADVAMYYYKTDLRTSGAKALDNVPTSEKDITPQQHMVTFTLGMGLTGLMDYLPNYETSATGDFAKIKTGSSGCPWATGTCNWPTPASGASTTLDDLWHAAVNGRGAYYSASDPNTLAESLSSALNALKVITAAASAAATSTPNITQTDNLLYSSTYRTASWDGEMTAQHLDTNTALPTGPIVWSARALLDSQVSDTADTRKIYTLSTATTSKLKPFLWGNLTSGEQALFSNQCSALSQCSLLNSGERAIANDGQNMVNYLRGQTQYGTGTGSIYRSREHVLGDTVNSTPAFVRVPLSSFNDAVTPTYGNFKSANASRQGTLYVASNDGMLHAFNGDTGVEMWAYVPRMVFAKLPALASENWNVRHQYIVDGTPQVMDVYDASASAWKTILVAGLNKGGRGYYALDITDPNSPKGLWEVCSDSSTCAISDNDFGFSYGYPITTKRASDGKWVTLVTSGMNNVTPGSGRGYLFVLDALTGTILQKVDTGAGDATTPSGFAKISGFANSFNTDNTATYVYGGDLFGNLWRFDMSTTTPAVLKLARLTDASGKPQSITTRPELSIVAGSRAVYVGTGRYLGPDDFDDPATLSPPQQWAYQNSFYGIKDRGVALGNIRTSSPGLVQQILTDLSPTTRTASKNAVDWATRDGWYIDFNPGNSSPGERVNLDPLLFLGTLVVTTTVPGNTVCTAGGDSFIYQLSYKSGSFIASAPGQVVAQKFVGSQMAGTIIVGTAGGVKIVYKRIQGPPGAQSGNTDSPLGVGKRVSWRELIQ